MKKYILKFDGNGVMLLFTFSILLMGAIIILAFSGFNGGFLLETFNNIPAENAEDTASVVMGFLLVPVLLYWLFSCFVCFLSTFIISKKLDKGQRKRFAAVYFIFFSIIINSLLPFAVIYLPFESYFHICATIIYILGLKISDRLIIKPDVAKT